MRALSGRSDADDAARIHDAKGVEGKFDGTHGIRGSGWADAGELVALQAADAVLGRNRAAESHDRVEYGACDCGGVRLQNRRAGAGGFDDRIVQVAVADMAEDHKVR